MNDEAPWPRWHDQFVRALFAAQTVFGVAVTVWWWRTGGPVPLGLLTVASGAFCWAMLRPVQ